MVNNYLAPPEKINSNLSRILFLELWKEKYETHRSRVKITWATYEDNGLWDLRTVHFRKPSSFSLLDRLAWYNIFCYRIWDRPLSENVHFQRSSTFRDCPLSEIVHFQRLSTFGDRPVSETAHFSILSRLGWYMVVHFQPLLPYSWIVILHQMFYF